MFYIAACLCGKIYQLIKWRNLKIPKKKYLRYKFICIIRIPNKNSKQLFWDTGNIFSLTFNENLYNSQIIIF
ncbi:hypothetical protein T07_4370 [Trichinella nelsoni]|uniref:Uncharacterized protein n=1 Tax=Trichinella nelsoni TaxID=6336 RepID=A0A0V0RWU9_9BILA|nr:hypothetical protein T07_4370 [Trichinella nelsoni]